MCTKENLPRVFYIALSDAGGGAEERLRKTAKNYGNTLELYSKHVRLNESFVKKFSPHWSDKFFDIVNKLYQKIFKDKVHIKFRLGITERYNFTWSRIKSNPNFWKADIVHISNIHGNYFDLNALSKICKHKKVLLNVSDMWLFTGGEAYTLDDMSFAEGRPGSLGANLPPLNGPFFDSRKKNMALKKRLFEKLKDRLFFTTNSHWMQAQFELSFVMRHKPHNRLIVPGVDTDVFKPGGEKTWTKPRVLVYVSESPFKNFDIILKGLEKLEVAIDLYLIGKRSTKIVANKYINIVEQARYVSSELELASIMQSVDIFLYPSLAEAFGVMVTEAKACGLCVIGSSIGGITEQLHPDKGILVDPRDSEEFAKQLNRVAADLSFARQMGQVAADDVQRNFSMNKYMQEVADYYKHIYPLN